MRSCRHHSTRARLSKGLMILSPVHLRNITTNKDQRFTVTLGRAVLGMTEYSKLWLQSFLDVDCCRCLEFRDAPPSLDSYPCPNLSLATTFEQAFKDLVVVQQCNTETDNNLNSAMTRNLDLWTIEHRRLVMMSKPRNPFRTS